MLSLEEILSLNNEAVALFNAYEPLRAFEKLHSSLLGARSLILQTTPLGINHNNPNGSNLLQNGEESPRIQSEDRNGYFLFLRALAFREPEERQGSRQALCVYSAGILFNLAILYHRRWMNDGSSSILDKAAVLYRSILNILRGNFGSQVDPTALLLAYVTYNNLVQIELENGMVENVNQGLSEMTQILDAAELTLLTMLSEREAEGVFSNVYSATRSSLTTAHAA
ncbi:MAG: hypothetical protein SGBAC_012088 [Bacillariaceae sp.]